MIQGLSAKIVKGALAFVLVGLCALARADDALINEVSQHYAKNNGVNIHYVKAGQGPLVIMIHGFPDYWYSWREQMKALKDRFTVVAIDQRGYNRSDQP